MRCDEFETRLHMLLDQRRGPEQDVRLREHAAVCAACGQMLRAQTLLFDTLEMRTVPELDAGFAARVVARVEQRNVRGRRRTLSAVAAIVVVAASLLLVLFGPARPIWQRPGSESLPRHALSTRHAVPAARLSSPTMHANRHQDTHAAIWWVLSPETLQEIYPPDVRQRHLQQVDRLANDLRPIARPFTAAAAALRRTFPVGRNRTPKGRPQASQLSPRGLSRWG